MYSTRMSDSGILLNASEREQEDIIETVSFATETPIMRIYECSTRELINSRSCWSKSNADYGKLLDSVARKWFYEDVRANYLYKAYLNKDGMVHSVRIVEAKEAQLV